MVLVVYLHFFCLPRVFGRIWRPKLTHGAVGLLMCCGWHDAILSVLQCKHNGQAALNPTMENKHSVLHIFTSKTINGKSPCASLISHCILLENQVYAVVWCFEFSNFVCQNILSAACFWTSSAVFKEKLFPRILTQPTSSFVYICDLLFRGFAVVGCSGFKR